MRDEMSQLPQDLEEWIRGALAHGATLIVVNRLKLNGGIAATLHRCDVEKLKGREAEEAKVITGKAIKATRALGCRQIFAFAWAADDMPGEQQPFAVDPDITGTATAGGDEAAMAYPPNQEGVIALLMKQLNARDKRFNELQQTVAVMLDKSFAITGGTNEHLRQENDRLWSKQLDVMDISLKQAVERHQLEVAKIRETAKTERSGQLMAAANKLIGELSPTLRPMLTAAIAGKAGFDPNTFEVDGIPIKDMAMRIVQMIQSQQTQLNGLMEATAKNNTILDNLKAAGVIDAEGRLLTPPPVSPPVPAPAPAPAPSPAVEPEVLEAPPARKRGRKAPAGMLKVEVEPKRRRKPEPEEDEIEEDEIEEDEIEEAVVDEEEAEEVEAEEEELEPEPEPEPEPAPRRRRSPRGRSRK